MWQQNYLPIEDSLFLSAFLAAIPIFVLLTLIGIMRKPAWVAAVSGLATALVISVLVYEMPAGLAVSAVSYGAAQGLFPIGWIVYWAIVMYRVTLDTGKFEMIKDSIGGLTADRRLQAMLIAFAFGAFIEGASGFGTPVAVAAAINRSRKVLLAVPLIVITPSEVVARGSRRKASSFSAGFEVLMARKVSLIFLRFQGLRRHS